MEGGVLDLRLGAPRRGPRLDHLEATPCASRPARSDVGAAADRPESRPDRLSWKGHAWPKRGAQPVEHRLAVRHAPPPAVAGGRCRTRWTACAAASLVGERPASLPGSGVDGCRALASFRADGRAPPRSTGMAGNAARRRCGRGFASRRTGARNGNRAPRARGSEGNTPPRGRDYADELSARTADTALPARHLR